MSSSSSSLAPPSSQDIYGAPWTNSVTMAPLSASPGTFRLTLRVPGLAACDVDVREDELLSEAAARVARACGAGDAVFVRNGAPLREGPLGGLFGGAVDVSLDGLRYSLNSGLRMTRTGAAPRRSALAGYAAVGAAGAAVLVGCFAFWAVWLPVSHNKIKQAGKEAGR